MRRMPIPLLALVALLLAPRLAIADLALEGELVQGGLVHGRAAPGSQVRLDDRTLRLDGEGRFIAGFGRDHPAEALLEVRLPGGRTLHQRLEIAPRAWDIQRIDGLPARMVSPMAEEDLVRIRRDRGQIDAVKRRDSVLAGFREVPVWPATGPISGIFGSQRILNGEPRAPHLGVDVAAPTGTPVVAMASGVVALAEPDLFFTGGTVFLDHGHGLTSVYAHLDSVLVEAGREVAQGAAIGTIGATGRVTGPHLHWGIYWFDQPVDPMPLVGPMPPG
jgi:hypothetical protein